MSKHRVDLKTTSIFGQRQTDVKNILERVIASLTLLPTLDQDLPDTKLRMSQHTVDMSLLFHHQLIIEGCANCKSMSWQLWELILSISKNPNLSPTLKEMLIRPYDWLQYQLQQLEQALLSERQHKETIQEECFALRRANAALQGQITTLHADLNQANEHFDGERRRCQHLQHELDKANSFLTDVRQLTSHLQ